MRRLGRIIQAPMEVARWSYAVTASLCLLLGAVAQAHKWPPSAIFATSFAIGAFVGAADWTVKALIGWYRRRQFVKLVLKYGATWGDQNG